MENNEKKKSNTGLIIIIIIIVLLLLFAVWFFFLKDRGIMTRKNNVNNTQENINTGSTPSKGSVEYNYFDGKLTQIVDEEGKPKQSDFVIDGIILMGNRHSYDGIPADGEGVIEALAKKGYNKDGINTSFYLNEYIQFYIDTKYTGSVDNVKILVVPHRTVEELEKMSSSKLEELATENGGFILNYQTPDPDNYKYVGEGYVHMDYPEGKYDILFTYKGKLAYFININETKEPNE